MCKQQEALGPTPTTTFPHDMTGVGLVYFLRNERPRQLADECGEPPPKYYNYQHSKTVISLPDSLMDGHVARHRLFPFLLSVRLCAQR